MRYWVAAAISVLSIAAVLGFVRVMVPYGNFCKDFGIMVHPVTGVAIDAACFLQKSWALFAVLIFGIAFSIAVFCGKRE